MAETKKSKVVGATFKKSGTGQYGEWHAFQITMENGDSGDYLSKTNPQNAFVTGQTVDYEIGKDTNGYWKIKPIRQQGGFKVNPEHENKRVALKCAVELVSHGIIPATDLEKSFEKFKSWLNK